MARTARPNQLTDRDVLRYVNGPETTKELHDGAGLYLRRRDAGAYWYLRAVSPVTGRPQWHKLFDGDALDGYPHKTLRDARQEADRLRLLLKDGLDPRIERRKSIEREQAAEKARADDIAAARTVEDLFSEFKRLELRPVIKNGVRISGRKDGGAGVEAQLKLHVFPRIGQMAARDVRRADLLKVLDVMREKDILRSANIVLQIVKQFFAWAGPDRRGYIPTNPAAGLDKRDAGGRDVIRKRHLCATKNPPKREELSVLAEKLPKSGLSESMQAAVWLMLSTMVRVGELAGARWEHVDLDGQTWHLPQTKNQQPHLVHLSPFAVAQFKRLQAVRAERIEKGLIPKACPWVLPSRDGKTHVSALAITKQLTDRQVEGEPLKNRSQDATALALPYGRWVAHDLRRTGATLMRQKGISSETVHLCLNHRDQKLLAETYEQDSDEGAQKAAFETLGAALAALSVPTPPAAAAPPSSRGKGNVVPMRQARAA